MVCSNLALVNHFDGGKLHAVFLALMANLLPHHEQQKSKGCVPNHILIVHSEFADSHIGNHAQVPVGVGNYWFFGSSPFSSEPVAGLTLYRVFSFSSTDEITFGIAVTSTVSAHSYAFAIRASTFLELNPLSSFGSAHMMKTEVVRRLILRFHVLGHHLPFLVCRADLC